MGLEIYPGKVENIAFFLFTFEQRKMLILYSYNFGIVVKVFWNFRLQNVCWEQCGTFLLPNPNYIGDIFGWNLTLSLLFVQCTIELERGKILPFSNCKWGMYFCYFVINGHFVSLCIVSLTISAPATLWPFSKQQHNNLVLLSAILRHLNWNTVQSRFSDTFGLCKNCHLIA